METGINIITVDGSLEGTATSKDNNYIDCCQRLVACVEIEHIDIWSYLNTNSEHKETYLAFIYYSDSERIYVKWQFSFLSKFLYL